MVLRDLTGQTSPKIYECARERVLRVSGNAWGPFTAPSYACLSLKSQPKGRMRGLLFFIIFPALFTQLILFPSFSRANETKWLLFIRQAMPDPSLPMQRRDDETHLQK
jgi:hypothetical protein